jgi:tetratricopeptide (TPR) repeat protein
MAYQSEIEKLEQRYHENPQQWFAALADSYRKAGDLDLALEVVRGGLEKRPSYASGHIVLGRCLVDKQLYDEAAGVFEQVLELDAENIIALKSLGDIAEHNGDLAGAKSWLSRLLDIDPMNEEAREGMDRIHEAELAAPPEAADEASSEESPQPAIEPGAAWAAEALATMDDSRAGIGRGRAIWAGGWRIRGRAFLLVG